MRDPRHGGDGSLWRRGGAMAARYTSAVAGALLEKTLEWKLPLYKWDEVN